MGISIHDRVKIIKGEQELDTSGADAPVPAHGTTHVATGSDPVPSEIDGITADMTGIADGEVPAYDLATNKFLPGAGGGGGVPAAHAASHIAGASDAIPPEIDGITADMSGIADGEVPIFDFATGTFLAGEGNVKSHAATHVAGAADAIDPEIDGIEADMTGITDGQVPTFDLATGKFIAGNTEVGIVPYIDLEDGLAAPAIVEGRLFYDDEKKCLAYYNDQADVIMQVGRENWVRAINNTGTTITNGQVVYVSGADALTELPEVSLATADNYAKHHVLAVATQEVADGVDGEFTRFGLVNGLDTSEFDLGDILYLAAGVLVGNLLVDGDMEKSGVVDWGTLDAVLTKSLVDPFEGRQCLKITSTANTFYASQAITSAGKYYRVTGVARSFSGSAIPRISDATPALVWEGTTSTDWQEFDFTFVSTGALMLFGSPSAHPGVVEFDDIRVVDTIIQDGDMELAGVAEWDANNNPLITKETTDPHSGSQLLRVAYIDTTAPRAGQTILEVGKKYKIGGWARSDGTQNPRVYEGNTSIWAGFLDTDWHEIAFTFTATQTTFRLGHSGSSGYAEFDGITIEEIDYIGGALTNIRPNYPARPVVVGYCTNSDAVDGSVLTIIENDQFDYEFEGTVVQKQDVTVTESGGVVSLNTELLGGGDLPVQLGSNTYLLDCTTTGPASVALTAGTDTVPQFNYVFIRLVAGVATLQSSVTAPTGAFANVAYVSLWSAAKTATDGPALFQRTTDAKAHDGRGRIAYIDDKLRKGGATYDSGVIPTATITTQGAAFDNLDIEVTAGVVWQLHPQSFPVLDSAVDGIYVANASGAGVLTNYQKLTDLNQCREYADGSVIPNLARFNLVIWGAVNKATGDCKLFVNLPIAGYTSDDSAYYDVNVTAVTSVDSAMKNVAFLIARVPVKYTTAASGTLAFINPAGLDEIISLLGVPLGVSAAGASVGGGASTLNQLTDVEVTTPADQQTLEYNATSGLWENVEGGNARLFQGVDIEALGLTEDRLGPQLMADSDCEASGVASWLVSGSATLTKTGASLPPGGGNQSLKIAYNGVSGPFAYQSKAVVGKRYILSFWARGDGTNGGSATGPLTIAASADWVPYFVDYVAGSTSVAFVASNVAGAYIQIDNVNLWEVREDLPVDGKHYRESYLENLLTYSEHYTAATSDWTNNDVTVNENSGMLSSIIDRDTGLPIEMQAIQCNSSAGSVAHNVVSGTLTGLTVGDSYVAQGVIKAGSYNFVLLLVADGVSNPQMWIDLDGLDIGVTGTREDYSFTRLPGGDVLVRMQFAVLATSVTVRVYPANSITNVTFVGDDKDGIYVTALQVYQGTLADNPPYIKTTTAAETGRQEFLLEKSTIKEDRTKAGLLERIVNDKPSGIFETPQNNTLYVAPDHIQHKGNGNLVYAQAVFGDGVSGDVSHAIASDKYPERLIDVSGAGLDWNNYWYPIGYYVSATTFFQANLSMSKFLVIERGSAIADTNDKFNVMFYFTLQENPDQE